MLGEQTAGQRLIAAAQEMLSIARGEADPTSYKLYTSADIAQIMAKNTSPLVQLRRAQGLTQQAFAAKYNITLSRLRDWEQGRSQPDALARAYIKMIETEQEAVERALKKLEKVVHV